MRRGRRLALWRSHATNRCFSIVRKSPLNAVISPPKLFTPTRFFSQSLADPPTPANPIKLPWLGVIQMTGLTKDVAEAFKAEGCAGDSGGGRHS